MTGIDSEWFYKQLEIKGASLRELARFMSLDPSAVSRLLKAERKMSAEEQDQIALFFDLPLNEIAARRRGGAQGFEEGKQTGYVTSEESQPADKPEWKPGDIHPIFGCMKGTMTIPDDLDLTAPADPDWGKVYED